MSSTATSEPHNAFKWAQALSELVDLTVLCQHHQDASLGILSQDLPRARVVTWPLQGWRRPISKFDSLAKLSYFAWYRHVGSWISAAISRGEVFDVAHQITPQAPRYPSPLRSKSIPYILGPVGGLLPTPPGFVDDVWQKMLWYDKLRRFDHFRLRYDPWLRATYRDAAMVVATAPYIAPFLDLSSPEKLRYLNELGLDDVPPGRRRTPDNRLRLLHVGRGVRTKGLRDSVVAMAHLGALKGTTLTSVGSGPEVENCRRLAKQLGLDDRIHFEGQVPRTRVEELYTQSDIFVFPSFREAGGNVLYESMRHGLPVVTVDYGGPGAIIDDACGIRVPLSCPEQLPLDIAAAIQRIALEPGLYSSLSEGAKTKMAAEALWPNKAETMVEYYEEVLDQKKIVSRR